MPRYGDRDRDRGDRRGSSTRLYVGHLSSRTRTNDLDDLFSRYGRFLGFCLAWRSGGMVALDGIGGYSYNDFSDPRDAEDARYSMNGRDVDGSRIIVEFAKGTPRGPGGARDYGGRGPPPGSGRCFNCGIDGHWARDCKAGDWKNKCYRCGERGHIEKNCQNSPKKLRRGRSYSRSPSPRRRSPSPRRGRSRSRSFSRSRSYSRSRSPPRRERDGRDIERASRSRSPRQSRSPRRQKGSPVSSRGRNRSPSPDDRSPEGRGITERDERQANGSDYGNSPRSRSRSPMKGEKESPRNGGARSRSPYDENGRDRSISPDDARNEKNGRDDDNDEYDASPRGSG